MPVALLLFSFPSLLSLLVCPFPPLAALPPSPPREQLLAAAVAFVILSFHPRSTLRTVASSGSGGHSFSPSFSSCSPLPPREQLLSWCQLVPALRCPVVHPASRGSQRQCGRRVPSRVSSAGGVAMWQGVLTSWLSHFPELSDTSYVASHLIYMGRRGWVDWDIPCCRKPKKRAKKL